MSTSASSERAIQGAIVNTALLCVALVLSCGRGLCAAGGTVVILAPWGNVNETNVPAGLTNVVAVSAGLDDALALREDGTMAAWGISDYGITNVPASLTNVVAISSGWLFHMALKSDGTVATWGHYLTIPPADLSNVVAIAAGGHQFCLALRSDRTVVAWGWNGWEETGPTNVPPGLTNVIAVAAGLDHSLALREDGTVVAWGDNTFGVTDVPTNLTNVVAIAAGWSQSWALRGDGTVVGWGMSGTNLPFEVTNVVAISGGWDAGADVVFQDGTLLWNYGVSNVMAVARGHFFAVAITAPTDVAAISGVPLSEASWAGGRFEAAMMTAYGRTYAAQYKERLTDRDWTPLPLVAGNGTVRRFADSNAQAPQRFYRVLRH